VTSPICVDASVVVRLVTGQERAEAVRDRFAGWYAAGRPLIAPALFGCEVANGLHRYVAAGAMSFEDARAALGAALDLGVEIIQHPAVHTRALVLAHQLGMPAVYDAHYLAVAEARDAVLYTLDVPLVRLAAAAGIAAEEVTK